MKLDLGCGPRKKSPEYIGIDSINLPGVDKILDLEQGKLPFETNSIEEINASHVLEHINNLIPLVEEIWRVLKPEGKFIVKTPHYKSETAYTDPTHLRFFTKRSFNFYDKRKVAYKESGWFTSYARFHVNEVIETEREIIYDMVAKKKKILMIGPPCSSHTIKWKHFLSDLGHSVDLAARVKKGEADFSIGAPDYDKITQIDLFPREIGDVVNNYEVVHAHFATRYGHSLENVPSNIKKVLSIWGEDVLDEAAHDKKKKEYLIKGLKSADDITTTANCMKDYLITHYSVPSDKIWVFPWGYLKKIFYQNDAPSELLTKHLDLSANNKILLSARICRPQNNIDKVVDAFKMIGLDAQLLILTGDLADRSYLDYLKNKCASMKNITFLPTLSYEELSQVYNISEATISIPDVDQLSTTILESMACGTPVIGSNLEVYKERIQDGVNGFILKSNAVDSLSKLMVRALESNFKRKNKENIIGAVANDSWEDNAKTLLKVYDRQNKGIDDEQKAKQY